MENEYYKPSDDKIPLATKIIAAVIIIIVCLAIFL